MFNDENLQVTFCGTNLHDKATCRCQHPVQTDDGASASVRTLI